MVDQSLLDILVCPETKQPLHVAEVALLDQVNASLRKGTLINRGGQRLSKPVEAGLVRKDGAFLYPVRDDIPIMLIDESIPLSQTQ